MKSSLQNGCTNSYTVLQLKYKFVVRPNILPTCAIILVVRQGNLFPKALILAVFLGIVRIRRIIRGIVLL